MRSNAPVGMPVALTVAGSDSGGGAGVQADLQTMASHGVYGTSVVTAVTAQNTRGVTDSHVLPVEQVCAQIDAVADDFYLGAVKTGMLATAPIVEAVTERLREVDAPAVVDPVMVATSGDRLLEPEAEAAYEELVASATLVTPNADEAAVLTDVEPTDAESARAAGEVLLDLGAEAALVKGGHVASDPVRDVLVTAEGATTFEHARIDTDATHGSGCALSAAIAAELARGTDLESAVETATAFLADAVRYSYDVGEGPGAVNHLVGLRDDAAREPTAEAVHDVVDALVTADAGPLVPDVGANVAGATPHAETTGDVAAVEGGIRRTTNGAAADGAADNGVAADDVADNGVADNGLVVDRGVRFGASSHLADALLAAREVVPALRFALDCRLGDDVEAAMAALDWTVAEVGEGSAGEETTDVEDGGGETSAASAATARALDDVRVTPVAVVDRGALGTEPSVRLLAPDAETLTERALALLEELRTERTD